MVVLVDGWIDGWLDGCMGVWMDGWMDGWVCTDAAAAAFLLHHYCTAVAAEGGRGCVRIMGDRLLVTHPECALRKGEE